MDEKSLAAKDIQKEEYIQEPGFNVKFDIPGIFGFEISRGDRIVRKSIKTLHVKATEAISKEISKKIVFHHIPAVSVVLIGFNIIDDDDKKKVKEDGLVIVVNPEDHAKLLTTKRNSVAYCKASVKEIKEKGKEGFKNVVMRDLIDLYKTSKETGHAEYQKTMLQFADKYLKTGDITPQGAEQIRSMVNGLPQTNFNSDYLIENYLYTFDRKNDADRILRNRLDGKPLDAPW